LQQQQCSTTIALHQIEMKQQQQQQQQQQAEQVGCFCSENFNMKTSFDF
jgi:hypothetical protein